MNWELYLIKEVNPSAKVITKYAGSFSDESLGKSIAKDMITQGVDYLYPAAGFTGVGAILAAQQKQVYAFGVDSDQYFISAEQVHAIIKEGQKLVHFANNLQN